MKQSVKTIGSQSPCFGDAKINAGVTPLTNEQRQNKNDLMPAYIRYYLFPFILIISI